MAEFRRTPYHAAFVSEIAASTKELEKENPDNSFEAVKYLSPLGTPISRVLVIGTALEKEDIGEEQQFWRLRVADHSGGIMVYAGQYQPEAAEVIAGLETPAIVAVTGKLAKYSPDENTTYISIRADRVIPVNEDVRKQFIAMAARATLHRYKNADENLRMAEEYGFDYRAFFGQLAEQVNCLLPEGKRVKLPEKTAEEEPAGQEQEGQQKEKQEAKQEEQKPQSTKEVIYEVMCEIGTGVPIKLEVLQNKLREEGYALVDPRNALEKLKEEGLILEVMDNVYQVI